MHNSSPVQTGESSYVAFEEPVRLQGEFVSANAGSSSRRSDSDVEGGSNTSVPTVGSPWTGWTRFNNLQDTNGGPFDISNVFLRIDFPSSFQFDSFSGNDHFGCSYSAPRLTCSASSFPANSSEFIQFQATPTESGQHSVQICSEQSEFDPNTGDNCASLNVNVQNGLSISGTVFHNLNGDLDQDTDEEGLSNVTVYIDSNNNGKKDAGEPTAQTDANGDYSFSPVEDGTHVIRVESSEFATLNPDDFAWTLILGGSSASNVNFGMIKPIYIDIRKFENRFGSSTFASGHPGVEGWAFTLTGTGSNPIFANASSATSVTRSTNTSGWTRFDNLRPGQVTLTEASQEGWTRSFPSGTDPITLDLISDQNVVNNGFGNHRSALPQLIRLHNDLDNNSIFDGGDSYLDGFTFFIDVDLSGSLSLGDVSGTTAGDTPQVELQPTTLGASRVCGVPSSGLTAYFPDPSGLFCQDVVFESNTQPPLLVFRGLKLTGIGTSIFVDGNGDTLQGQGEPGSAGHTISGEKIEQGGNTSIGTKTTDSNGQASFPDLGPGEYKMTVTFGTGLCGECVFSTEGGNEQTVTIEAGDPDKEVPFGIYVPGELRGIKFQDDNGDGVRQAGELALADWTIELQKSSGDASGPFAPIATTTTAVPAGTSGDAVYAFINLAPGIYRVAEIQQAGFTQTAPRGGANPHFEPSQGANVFVVTLGSGGSIQNLNFGNRPPIPTIIEGYKYVDLNGNGEDDNEPRLNGATIELVSGSTVVSTAVTADRDANQDSEINPATERGTFRFEGPDAGEYTIREVVPDGMTQTEPSGGTYSVTVTTGQENSTVYAFGNSGQLDWGDLPDPYELGSVPCPEATATECYRTLSSVNGAGHILLPNKIFMGERVDAEGDGQPNRFATGDDNNGGEDDEDGWTGARGSSTEMILIVQISDPGGAGGFLDVFGDLNDDGVISEQLVTSAPVVAGENEITVPGIGFEAFDEISHLRFRVSSSGGLGPHGIASDGEVEDYSQVRFDFGDAPTEATPGMEGVPFGYPVTLAKNAGYHRTDLDLRLGILPGSSSTDGSPSVLADGDSSEDGLSFPRLPEEVGIALPGGERAVVAGVFPGDRFEFGMGILGSGVLDAWVDFNRDGDWNDEGEKFISGRAVSGTGGVGSRSEIDDLTLEIPPEMATGLTYIRIRLSKNGLDSAEGYGGIGEVEDYVIMIVKQESVTSTADLGDVNPGDGVCVDSEGNCNLRSAIEEGNASGAPIHISFASFGGNKKAVVLTPQTPYPTFQVPIIIDGAGELEIDGSQAGVGAHGLVIASQGSHINDTVIHSFDGDGIRFDGGTDGSVEGSTIRNNGGAGISVVSGSNNSIRQNSIHSNGGPGIDLGADGATDNDVGDNDTGANGLINFPELSLVTAENGRIEGSVMVSGGADMIVDLFSNVGCDASGNGEGQTFLTSSTVTGTAGGVASFAVDLSSPLSIGDVITATATDSTGNTSEFSTCFLTVTTDIEREDVSEVPSTHRLSQNYPNPFNPITTIRFEVGRSEHVLLEVFDVLGKRVAGLVDRVMEPGSYTVNFDAADLPSGIYLYKMQAGTYAQTKTLTLLK